MENKKKEVDADYKKARNFGIGHYLAERWAQNEARLRNKENPLCWNVCDLRKNCENCAFKIEKW